MGEIRDNFKKAMSDMFGVGGEQGTPETKATNDATPTEIAVQEAIKAAQTATPKVAVPAVEKAAPIELPEIPVAQTAGGTVSPEPFKVDVPLQGTEAATPTDFTYISKDTTIVGNIQAGSDLHIKGKVMGDVACDSDVKLWGKLQGNLSGKSGVVQGGQIVGNVEMRGNMYVADAAHIKGDVQCSNLDLNSTVDGNLRVQHKTRFRNNATVVGNITTQTLVVDEGAMIEGYISMKDMQSRLGRPNFDADSDK